MHLDNDTLSDIEDRLTSSVMNPELWRETINRILEVSDSKGAAVIPLRGRTPGMPVSSSCEDLFDTYFRDDWYKNDYRMNGLSKAIRTGMLVDQDICSQYFMEKHPFYTEFLGRHGFKWFAGLVINLGEDAWGFTLQRGVDQDPFGHDDQVALHRLLAVLNRVGRFSQSVGEVRSQIIVDTLEAIRRPAALLNRSGQIVRVSSQFDELIDADFVIRERAICFPDDSDSTRQVAEHIRAAVWSDITPYHPDLKPVIVPRNKRTPLILHAQPLRKTGLEYFDGARALITIKSGHTSATLDKKSIQNLYLLTHREAELCAILYSGDSLKNAATTLNIEYETARSHLRSIFTKTQTFRQSDLLLLLSRLMY